MVRLLRLPCTEACEQDDEHAEEEQDHSCEAGPHAGGEIGVRDVMAVDMFLDGLNLVVSMESILTTKRVRRTPNKLKSIAMTTRVRNHANAATKAPKSDPTTPAPQLSAKAMKATAQAMGCSIIARVRPSTVWDVALVKGVPSTVAMISAGL